MPTHSKILRELAQAPAKKKHVEECLIDGMTPYSYERYQKQLMKEGRLWENCKDTASPSLSR